MACRLLADPLVEGFSIFWLVACSPTRSYPRSWEMRLLMVVACLFQPLWGAVVVSRLGGVAKNTGTEASFRRPVKQKCVSPEESLKAVESRPESRPFGVGISRKPEKPMARKKGGVNSFHGIPAFGNFPSQMAGFQAGFRRLSGIPRAKRTFSLKGVVVRGALPPCRPWASRVSA